MLPACPEASSGVQNADQGEAPRPCTHTGTAGVRCIPPCGPLTEGQEEESNPQAIPGFAGAPGWLGGDQATFQEPEVSAGREPAEDLGLGITSSFIKKELLYEEGHRDTHRDTFPDAARRRNLSSPMAKTLKALRILPCPP